MFGTNIRIDLLKLIYWDLYTFPRQQLYFFTLEPRPKGAKATTVFLYFCILNPPPNVWHKYQDGMKNVGLFTYPRNSSLSLPHALLNCARTTAVCLYFCIYNTTQDNAEQYNRINEIEN